VLDIQKRCDEAFRISEVTERFLKSFVTVVKGLTTDIFKANPAILKTEQEALQQAQLLMDRLVFLYFVQKKGWLNDERDYLYTRFKNCQETDPLADTIEIAPLTLAITMEWLLSCATECLASLQPDIDTQTLLPPPS